MGSGQLEAILLAGLIVDDCRVAGLGLPQHHREAGRGEAEGGLRLILIPIMHGQGADAKIEAVQSADRNKGVLHVQRQVIFAAVGFGQHIAQQRVAHAVDIVDAHIEVVLAQQLPLEAGHHLADMQVVRAVADMAVDLLAGQDDAQFLADGAVVATAAGGRARFALADVANIYIADRAVLHLGGDCRFADAKPAALGLHLTNDAGHRPDRRGGLARGRRGGANDAAANRPHMFAFSHLIIGKGGGFGFAVAYILGGNARRLGGGRAR